MSYNTWFYNTNLKKYPELQEIFDSASKPAFEIKSTLISGPVGVGKTHNAILMAKRYVENKISEESNFWHYSFEPFFITYMDYLQLLNDQRFGSDEVKTQAYYTLRDIQEAPFLILDDLRAAHGSAFEKNLVDNALLNLLSLIWANRKSKTLIVTSNNSETELRASYSEAVCSRLFGLCEYIEVTGEDKRQIK